MNGDGVDAGGLGLCYVVSDNDDDTVTVVFQLGSADEQGLGGFDFTFDITCEDGTHRHSNESFNTQVCE
ncbi:MAG: hypothetical protein ABI461_08200, partial [Polyangiaceae bacterium]